MSVERIPTAPAAAAAEPARNARAEDRARLAKLAAEFESLLLANVLRDMRSAGRWSEEDSSEMLGAGAFGQTFDTELARTLSQAGGFGLSGFLLKAFDSYAPTATASIATAAPALPAPEPPPARTPAAAASAGSIGAAASPEVLLRPTATLTSGFGWRKDPLTGAATFHRGVDLKAAEGDPVGATGAGRVVFSGQNGGYGTNVIVEHANGLRTRYAHLSAALVSAGDQVSEGQAIGLAGHTGRATGPHVHYEVLAGGHAVDPLK